MSLSQHRALLLLPAQVRDRATLHLTQLAGAAGGPEDISPSLDINLAAMEASLRSYIDTDDTQQAFDVVSSAPLSAGCSVSVGWVLHVMSADTCNRPSVW